jgi:hypothetical protein
LDKLSNKNSVDPIVRDAAGGLGKAEKGYHIFID